MLVFNAFLQPRAPKLARDIFMSVPGRHLQLQIAMARADKGLTALRQRMASMNLSMGKCGQWWLGKPSGSWSVVYILCGL
jgi:hypothetical protein